jgi:hypothetical protein
MANLTSERSASPRAESGTTMPRIASSSNFLIG